MTKKSHDQVDEVIDALLGYETPRLMALKILQDNRARYRAQDVIEVMLKAGILRYNNNTRRFAAAGRAYKEKGGLVDRMKE